DLAHPLSLLHEPDSRCLVPSDDGVEQSYYVGAKVRLAIRIDEFGATGKLAKAKSTLGMKGVADPKAPLQYKPDATHPGRFILSPVGSSPTPKAAAGDQARSADGLTFDITLIPKMMTWNLAGPRRGDTLHVTLKWIDCPLDPWCIRACSVDPVIGASSSQGYVTGIHGEALAVIPDSYTDANFHQRTNLRFRGWVDKWEIT